MGTGSVTRVDTMHVEGPKKVVSLVETGVFKESKFGVKRTVGDREDVTVVVDGLDVETYPQFGLLLEESRTVTGGGTFKR